MAFNPKSLQNLKMKSGPLWTSETAKIMQQKSLEARLANKERRETMKKTLEAWKDVKKELPDVSPLDILEMAMMDAVTEGNFEDAARYANMLAPYKAAKLASIEQTIKTDIKQMSDEDLHRLIAAEGLKMPVKQLLDEGNNDDTDK